MRLGVYPALLVLGVLLAACATPRVAIQDLAPGERPALGSDEAGLWMVMDRAEERLRTSGHLFDASALVEYLHDLASKLAPSHRPGIRVYLIDEPEPNASMAPNGALIVHTGMLLRTRNESQLAGVLGHEIAHFLRRHVLQTWRTVRSGAAIKAYADVLTVGLAAPVSHLALAGSVFAFSRENEREADELGLDLMAKAGYDPRQIPEFWQGLLAEQTASEAPTPWLFLSTHPTTEERIATLTDLAVSRAAVSLPLPSAPTKYAELVQPLRCQLLRSELRRRDFDRTQALLDRLLKEGSRSGDLLFVQGELYRLRGGEGDRHKALGAYEEAGRLGGAPSDLDRSMGALLISLGEKARARASFVRYLEVAPEAEDRQLIRANIEKLQ